MATKGDNRLRILRCQCVEIVEVEEMNRHVMLYGAEKFHYGGFIGMPVSRSSVRPLKY